MPYLYVCHVFYWIWMKSLLSHISPWYISVTMPWYDCCNILCNNPGYATTRKCLFWLLGSLIFYFLVVQITPTGKRESSFPAEPDSSLEFNTTSPNSKHIFLLLQFCAYVMTVFLCCDWDLGKADEKRTKDEGNGGKFTRHIKEGRLYGLKETFEIREL